MKNKFDYERWCIENNIDEVVEKLCSKSQNIYKSFPENTYVYVDEWNATVAEIYSPNVYPSIKNIFEEEYNFFSKIDNLQRVMYMFTDPKKDITEHVDDDDTETYRILVGVHSSGDTWFENLHTNDKKYLTKGQSIGINVGVDFHKGRNNTDDVWSILIICLYKDKL